RTVRSPGTISVAVSSPAARRPVSQAASPSGSAHSISSADQPTTWIRTVRSISYYRSVTYGVVACVSSLSKVTTTPPRLRPTDIGKPRMRGWLHVYAFFGSAVAGIVLVSLVATIDGRPRAVISCAIYSVTVCALFGTSALYHRRVWSERWYRIMR